MSGTFAKRAASLPKSPGLELLVWMISILCRFNSQYISIKLSRSKGEMACLNVYMGMNCQPRSFTAATNSPPALPATKISYSSSGNPSKRCREKRCTPLISGRSCRCRRRFFIYCTRRITATDSALTLLKCRVLPSILALIPSISRTFCSP